MRCPRTGRRPTSGIDDMGFRLRGPLGKAVNPHVAETPVGVRPSVHGFGDHFSARLLILPKAILRTPHAKLGHVENRRAYAGRSPLSTQLRG
jgi:hypothetical protein